MIKMRILDFHLSQAFLALKKPMQCWIVWIYEPKVILPLLKALASKFAKKLNVLVHLFMFSVGFFFNSCISQCSKRTFIKYKPVFRKPEPEGLPWRKIPSSLSVMLSLIWTCMHTNTKKRPDVECMVFSLPPLLTATFPSLFLEKKWTIFHGPSSPASNEEAEGHWFIGEWLWYWYMSFYIVILVSPDSFLLSCFSGALSLECICHFNFILSKHKQST